MQAAGHRKQILFFLIAVILPSLVLIVFTLRMIRQERELAQMRIKEERSRLSREIGENLFVRLEKIKIQEVTTTAGPEPWQTGVKYRNPEVALLGLVDGDRLLMPWELDRKLEESLRLLNQPNFRAEIGQAERMEFSGGGPDQAATLHAQILKKAAEPVQREYARLLLARALAKAGKKTEALALYRTILNLSSEVRDEFGLPLSYYAAGSLIDQSGDHGRIVERITEELQTRSWFSPGEAYRLRDLIEELGRSTSRSPWKAVADCQLAIQEHLQRLTQALELQRDFQGLRLALFPGGTAQKGKTGNASGDDFPWGVFGENPWLITLVPAPSDRLEVLLAVEAHALMASLRSEKSFADAFPQDFSLVAGASSDGEFPGDNFRGLRITFAGNAAPIAPPFRAFQPLFYQLVVLLVVSMTLFGAYLLWKDIRRELHLAGMRSQFVSSVSHELKTPLTAIRMFAETLRLRRAKNQQMEQEYLDTIVNESERLTRLLNNVLDFSKIEKGKKMYRPQPADLAGILRAAVRAMDYPLGQQGFDLRVDIEDNVPEVCVDRDALEQAVLNLLHNAMKYSGDARSIELRLKRADRCALIQVADRGIGIEPREQKRIFEKFYRIPSKENERLPGTGLGLALVDHIAKAHGGRVEVASTPGQGSTFSIFLPLEKP